MAGAPSDSTPKSGTQSMGQAGSAADDATVTAQVKAALIAEPILRTAPISVDTKDGVVTLAGTVNSQTHSERAVQLAAGTTGVRQVVDKLIVQTS
jgi:hyperosmotically inducible protein